MDAGFPFVRLPREIRDEIYIYYVQTDDGLYYDFEAGKLLTSSDSKPIDVSLQFTCHQVASEMRGVALRENRITFTTGRSQLALRYSFLMRMQLHALDYMLRCCIHLVTPELLAEVAQIQSYTSTTLATLMAIGTSSQRELALLSLLDTSNSCTAKERRAGLRHRLFSQENGDYSIANRQLVQDILARCSVHTDFGYLTSEKVWRSEIPERFNDMSYIWAVGWQQQMIAWRPKPWAMPSREEVDRIGGLMLQPSIDYGRHETKLIDEQEAHAKEKSLDFFSAATIAIKFLEGLATDVQLMLRHIVLLEDWKSYTFPETHGRGLLPFIVDNPKIRIERRVDLWRSVFPNIFTIDQGLEDIHVQHPEMFGSATCYFAVDIVKSLQEWIDEAVILQRCEGGNSYALVLDGPPDTRQYVLDSLKTAAAGQETVLEIEKRDSWKPGSYRIPDDPYYFKGVKCTVGNRGSLPCYVSTYFPQAVRDIMSGNSLIQLDATQGEDWDVDEILAYEEPGYEGGWDYLTDLMSFMYHSAEGRTPPFFLEDEVIDRNGEPMEWVQSQNLRFLKEWTDGMDGWDRMIREC